MPGGLDGETASYYDGLFHESCQPENNSKFEDGTPKNRKSLQNKQINKVTHQFTNITNSNKKRKDGGVGGMATSGGSKGAVIGTRTATLTSSSNT